jgi:arylsulfatase A-like enzyme
MCVIVYLWSLEFQAIYGTGFAPLLDRLADASAILWTLIFWSGFSCIVIALFGGLVFPSIVTRLNTGACSLCCFVVTIIFLGRWLIGLQVVGSIFWLVVIGVAIMYALVWLWHARPATSSCRLVSWQDCFSYFALPILLLTALTLGIKIGGFVMAQKNALAFFTGDLASEGPENTSRVNVILMVADSLRARSMSVYGHQNKTTPFLQRLGQSSTIYFNMHANGTTTLPSMLTVLTGKTPFNHGRWSRLLPRRVERESVVNVLRSHGYSTGAIASNIYATYTTLGLDADLTQPEATEFNYLTLSWLRELGVRPTRLGSRMYSDLASILPFFGFPRRTSDHGRIEETLYEARAAVSQLRPPFFLSIHIHEPHEPYSGQAESQPGAPMAEQTKYSSASAMRFYSHYDSDVQSTVDGLKKLYEASVHRVDAELEKFFSFLASKPWFRNTLIIVTADHGESFERGYLNHGEELYESSTHIPLIIRFPQQRYGYKILGLTQSADIGPTILRTLNIPVPSWMDGQPLAMGKPPAPAATAAVNFRYPENGKAFLLPTKLALWWDRYKLILSCDSTGAELYDLSNDPAERVNLADRQSRLVVKMKQKLILQMAKQSYEPKLSCQSLLDMPATDLTMKQH